MHTFSICTLNTLQNITKIIYTVGMQIINSQCNFCGQDEDYLHYFMSCPYLKEFWVKIQQILKKSNIENFGERSLFYF